MGDTSVQQTPRSDRVGKPNSKKAQQGQPPNIRSPQIQQIPAVPAESDRQQEDEPDHHPDAGQAEGGNVTVLEDKLHHRGEGAEEPDGREHAQDVHRLVWVRWTAGWRPRKLPHGLEAGEVHGDKLLDETQEVFLVLR